MKTLLRFARRTLAAAAALAALHFSESRADVLADAIAWWPAETTPADVVGNFNGSVLNASNANLSAYGPGQVGRAFSLDGTDDFVSVASTSALDLPGDFTIEAWVKTDAAGLSGERTIVSKRSSDNLNVSYVFFLRDGQPIFSSRNAGGTFAEVAAPGSIAADTWTHVAAALGGGQLKLYVNGQLVADAAYAVTRPATSGPLTIGAGVTAGPAGLWTGAIDELTLYDRALDQTEVAAIHTAGATGKPRHDAAREFSPTQNPAGAWSYRWLPAGTSLTPYDPAEATEDPNTHNPRLLGAPITTNGIDSWDGPSYVTRNSTANFVVFPSGGTQYDWAPHQMGISPGPGNERAVLRWTVPSAGRYAVCANFFGTDTRPSTVDAHVRHKSAVKFDGTVSSYRGDGVGATFPIEALAGDTVDFILGPDGDFFYDSSGIFASVVYLGPASIAIADSAFPTGGGQLTIQGGTGPYTVALAAGDLPDGLSISETGNVTGTAENGAYSFTLRVTDSIGAFIERTFTGAVENPVEPPLGIAAWWTGDDTVADIFGGAHVGAASPAYTGGKVGRAFSFDGTSQSLDTGARANPQPTGVLNAGTLTIEAWVKPEVRSDGTAADLFPANIVCNDRQNFGGVGIGANVFASGSSLWLELQTADPADAHHQVPGAALVAGQWHHVAVVITPGNAKTYLDGELLESFDYAQGALDGETLVRIGRHNDDAGYGTRRFFKGAIDEVAVYHRALPEAEIAAIHLAGGGGKQRHDAGREFNATPNPASPRQTAGALWTYGSLPSGTINIASFVLFDAFLADASLQRWVGTSGELPDVVRNFTAATQSRFGGGGTEIRWAPGQVSQNPSSANEFSVLRWTAPEAGRYAVSGSFTGIDAHGVTTTVHIYHNATQRFSGVVNNEFLGNGHSFTELRDVAEGDTIDFIVGSNGNFSFDNTGVVATIVKAQVVPLEPPVDVTIATSTPPARERLWTFTAEADDADVPGLAMRVQYAPATDPDVWSDLNVGGGTNSMTPPSGGDTAWSLAVHSLQLPVGAYFFRVLATAPNAIDAPTDAVGAEALGLGGSGAIAIANPGQPPPPVPDEALPIASLLAVKVDGGMKARQGSTFSFKAALDATPGFPADGSVHVQYSTNPSDANSWQNVIDLEFVENLVGGRKLFAEATDYVPTTDGLPAGQGLYFRTRTSAPNRLTAVGPLKKGVFTPVGPFTIKAGPIWRYISAAISTTSDGQGFDVYPGEEITYTVEFKNEGSIAATNVEVTIPVPKGTELVDHDQAEVSRVNGKSGGSVVWLIPNVPRGASAGDPGPEFTKFIKVRVLAAAGSKIAPALPSVKCDQIKKRAASVVGAVKNRDGTLRKSFVTEVLPPLKLTLTGAGGNVMPGELLDLTLTADNLAASAIANGTATMTLPQGVCVEALYMRDGTDFDGAALNPPTAGTNPSLTPAAFNQQTIKWNLGTVAAGGRVKMNFQVRVKYDLPLVLYFNNGTTGTPQIVLNYNLSATNSSGKTFSAYTSPVARAFNISGPAPASQPDLKLTKRALADGKLDSEEASQTLPGETLLGASFGEVATVIKNERLVYTLRFSNAGGAAAGNVVLFDEIPDGVAFRGFMRRDGTLLASDAGITLRDKKKAVIAFQDTARFDSVKFIEIALGTLGAGSGGEYSYVTQATGKPYTLVICQNGASVRQLGGKSKQKSGYFLQSGSLAAAALPAQADALYSLITDAPGIEAQQPVITGEFKPGHAIFVDVPYHIGGEGHRFRDVKLMLRIPKGYHLAEPGALGYNAAYLDVDAGAGTFSTPRGPLAGEAAPEVTAPDKKGNRQLVFTLRDSTPGPLPGGHNGVVRAVLVLPNPVPADLLTADGYLKEKPRFFVDRSGRREASQIALRESRLALGAPAALAGFLEMGGTYAVPAVRPLPPKQAEPFIGRIAPVSVVPGENVTFTIFFGNATPGDGYASSLIGGELVMGIPPGTELIEAGTTVLPTAIVPLSTNAAADSRYSFPIEYKRDGDLIVWKLGDLLSHGGGAVQLTVRVPASFTGNKLQDTRCYVRFQNGQPKAPGPITVGVKQSNPLSAVFDAIGGFFSAVGGLFDGAARDALQPHIQRFDHHSRVIAIAGIQALQLDNGVVVIPLGGVGGIGRTMVVGPKSKLAVSSFNVVAEDASNLVAIARDDTAGFEIHGLSVAPDGSPRAIADVWTPADAVVGLRNPHPSSSPVAAGAGNIVAAGGGNMVAAGAGNLVAAGAGNFVDNSTGQALSIPVGPIYSNMVAAGAGNMVAAGAGNIVAVGNLIGLDGGSMVAAGAGNMVAAGGLNLVARDQGMLVAAGGGNMVAAGAGNMVAAGGLNFEAADLPKVLGFDKPALIDLGGLVRDPEVLSSKVEGYLIGLDGGTLVGNSGNTLIGLDGGS